ncbi:MAG TPA: histone deacetylase [Solirubrobacteraceae bacterium]|nr:histone deacetylase [Solirubrobacteraceae bacterium]
MSSQPVFLEHHSSLLHDTGTHPENVQRMLTIIAELERHDYVGYERVTSPEVGRDLLERVHTPAHIDRIARICQQGGGELDQDTVISPASYTAALHAAGGAVELVRRLLAGGPGQTGFSVHRPPGHHAVPDRAMGFCLFNNIAVAARYALDHHGLERVLILDWDVHHGNGTSDAFWETDQVLFVSIHEWPLYPGTGRASEIGGGRGQGFTVNLPVPAGTGDEAYVSLIRDLVVPLARAYRPQLILVSAGFDAHLEDPLAACALSDGGFAAMAALMRDAAAELRVPIGCVLEGGYAVHALARSLVATMEALLPGVPAPAAAPLHHLAADARLRVGEFWPELV